MRRLPKIRSLLLASLPRHRPPLPLLHRPPPPRPRLVPFSTRTLSTTPAPDAASTARTAALAFLEAAELQESVGNDHQKALDLALRALGPLQESHGGWSLPVARALRLAGAAASRLGLLSNSLESLNAASEIADSLEGGGAEVATVGAPVHEQLARTDGHGAPVGRGGQPPPRAGAEGSVPGGRECGVG